MKMRLERVRRMCSKPVRPFYPSVCSILDNGDDEDEDDEPKPAHPYLDHGSSLHLLHDSSLCCFHCCSSHTVCLHNSSLRNDSLGGTSSEGIKDCLRLLNTTLIAHCLPSR